MKFLSGFLFAVLALGSTAFAAMNGPTGLAVDASGNLYVSNFNGNTAQVYNPAHKLIRTISSGVNQPYGLAVDGMGFLHVANYGGGAVPRYDSTGKLVGTLLGLVNPILLTVDGLSEVWVSSITPSIRCRRGTSSGTNFTPSRRRVTHPFTTESPNMQASWSC